MSDPARLASLVASRICHDLISPIGALNNGVELLSSGGVGGEEISLIAECADASRATLAFQRLAFGAAKEADTVSTADAIKCAAAYFSLKRFSISWTPPAAAEPKIEVQARLLLLLAALEAAPRGGGAKAVYGDEPGWLIDGATRRAEDMNERIAQTVLADRDLAEVSPAEVHMTLLGIYCKRMSRAPRVSETSAGLLAYSLAPV